MLKELYKETMAKHIPDKALIESTKNAMYNTLSASDSIERSALIGIAGTSSTIVKKRFNYKKLASCCALFAVVIGTAAICTFVATRNTTPDEDPFASSGHSAFEGDSPNDGKDSALLVPSVTTTTEYTAQTHSQTTQSTTVTSVSSQVSVETPSHTAASVTTIVTQTQTSAATEKITTTLPQTSVVTTTTAPVQTQAPEEPPKGFGYYDPQYDPNFREEFDPNLGDEFLFEHENIYYYFDCHKSNKVMLKIDGEDIPLRQAIDEKRIEPQDLLGFEGFICKGYYNDDHRSQPIDVHPNGEAQMQQSGGFMDFEGQNAGEGHPAQPAPGEANGGQSQQRAEAPQ